MGMTPNEYQEWTKTTAKYPAPMAFSYLGLGLAGEAGEVANKVKKVLRDSREYPTKEEATAILEEIGDVMWYVAQLSGYLGMDLETLMNSNKDKLTARYK